MRIKEGMLIKPFIDLLINSRERYMSMNHVCVNILTRNNFRRIDLQLDNNELASANIKDPVETIICLN